VTSKPDLHGTKVATVVGTTTGGTGRHLQSVLAGLQGLGAQVVVLGPAPVEETFAFSRSGARFEPVPISDRPHPLGDARTLAKLRQVLRSADVVHAHGLRAGALAALALALVRKRPPLIVTLHNAVIAGGFTAVVYGTLERIVARRADLVLGVSPDLEERMRRLGAREVGHALVPAPIASSGEPGGRDRLRAELGVGERALVVVVGRLAAQKGLSTLLDAASGWASREPRPLVAIAGEGPLEGEIRDRVLAEDLPVRLLGQRADIPALLAAADVAVVPSVWEGQPLIVQEMLRAGRPIVATRVGGIPGLTGEDAAILVPPADPQVLRQAVTRILDEPETAAALAAAARRRAAELPTEEDAVAQLGELYAARRAGGRKRATRSR
jgi:glycosyltransferase involved in cell wall biosynthesis